MFEADSVVKVGIDTVHLVGSFGDHEDVFLIDLLRRHGMGCDGDDLRAMNGRFGYSECVAHPDMLWVLFTSREKDKRAWSLQLKGAGCSHLGLKGVYDFLLELMTSLLGTKATRLDVCADLFESKGADLFQLMEDAVDQGDCWRLNKRITSARPIKDKSEGRIVGRTLYIGGAESSIRRRVYDKGQQLGEDRKEGERVRVEDEFRDDRANTLLVDSILARGEGKGLESLRETLVGALCCSFEFRRKVKKGEWEFFPWFSDFRDLMKFRSEVFVPADRKVATFDKWMTYMQGSHSPLLALQDIAKDYNALYGTSLNWGEVAYRLFGQIRCSPNHKKRREITGPAIDLLADIETILT